MDANKRLRDLAVSDSGFVFDPLSGATFSVNATGLSLLRGLQKGLGREELRKQLEDEFEVQGDDLSRDIDEFAELMRLHKLLPRDFRF